MDAIFCMYHGTVLSIIIVSKLTKYILSRGADRYCEILTIENMKETK